MQLSITSNLEAIENEWRCFEQRAACTPFQAFDWISAWQSCVGGPAGVKPAIVTGRRSKGEMLFILPLAIVPAQLGNRCVFMGHDLCDYNGPLLAPEFPSVIAPTDFASWWRAIEALLQKTEGYKYEVVLLDKCPARIGGQTNPLLALTTVRNSDCSYRTTLSQDWESYYAQKRSSATRSRDRNKRRHLTSNGELRLITANDPEDRKSTLRILFEQKSRWLAEKDQSGLPRYGFSNQFTSGHSNFYLSVASKAGSFVHVSRLEVGSTCVATNLGLQFRGSYYYILASYDDGPLSDSALEFIHLHELMRYAGSQGLQYFDFTIGDHAYKLDWADEKLMLDNHVAAAGWLGLPAARDQACAAGDAIA